MTINVGGYNVEIDQEDFLLSQMLNLRIVNKTRHRKEKLYVNYYTVEHGKRVQRSFHRLLMSVSDKNILVDHENGNGLDCRKSNLRLCSHADNARNARMPRRKHDLPRGVCRKGNGYVAHISFEGKKKYLGYYKCASQAAAVYNKAARSLHGEFAVTSEERHNAEH